MKLPPFKLEEYWKQYEFSAPYVLCPSDTEHWSLKDILALADSESKLLWNTLDLGYTESQGLPILRKEISSLYSKLTQDHILTTAGAEEAIYCAMQTLLSQNDHVVAIAPCYQSLESLPKALGCDLTLVHLDPAQNWQLSFEDLKKAFRSSTKLLVINFPHNPTGSIPKKEVFKGMIELARAHGAYILADEVYRYLEINEANRLPPIADAYEKGISINVMTKSFGLAGLRIGWLATQDIDILNQISSYKLYTSICNSAPSEILALIALRAKDHILSRNREILFTNLKHLDHFFKKHQDKFKYTQPDSGPMAFPELLLPLSVDQFAHDLVEKAGIMILPADNFDYQGNNFRIGFGRKNMPLILDKLDAYLIS